MDPDEAWMRVALAEGRVALSHGDVPVGAVVVCRGEEVARGHNTQELWGDPTAHAEMNAIRLAARRLGTWRLEGCDLYVTLEPCPMCAGAAVAGRMRRLVFGAWNLGSGAAGSLYNVADDPRRTHRLEVRRGVLAEQCAAELAAFFSWLRQG